MEGEARVAVTAHGPEAVSDRAKGELGWMMVVLAVAAATCIVALADGCGGVPAEAVKFASEAATVIRFADPKMRAVYASERAACLLPVVPDPARCDAAVQVAWAPYHAGLVAVHGAWCELDPGACQDGGTR